MIYDAKEKIEKIFGLLLVCCCVWLCIYVMNEDSSEVFLFFIKRRFVETRSSTSAGAICPTAVVTESLCHILIVLPILQTFKIISIFVVMICDL